MNKYVCPTCFLEYTLDMEGREIPLAPSDEWTIEYDERECDSCEASDISIFDYFG